MADRPETLDSQTERSDEIELENLEEEVKQMAEKIVQYREKLPDQLHNTLASTLAAQRPVNLTRSENGSDPGPSVNPNSDTSRPLDSGGEEDPEHAEKIKMIKDKFASNASAMLLLLKRMKDSMSRIDKLDSSDEVIHPAFKRKRTS